MRIACQLTHGSPGERARPPIHAHLSRQRLQHIFELTLQMNDALQLPDVLVWTRLGLSGAV